MIADKNLCGWCPDTKANLELIETRFQGGVCFAELRCKHCALLWTAEVRMPAADDAERVNAGPGQPVPGWRLVDVVRGRSSVVM